MILDTSPLVAILTKEPDSERYIDAISHAPRCRLSAGNGNVTRSSAVSAS